MKQNNTKLPLISIIIPVYNVAKYIDTCMQSVCTQTYSNLEIILVDDGSTDESGALCEKWKYQDNRIKLLHQTNKGLSAARNAALDIAQGEWIGFVDSDDWINTEMYESLYKLAKTENADIAACSYQREERNLYKTKYASGKVETFTNWEALILLVKNKRLQNHVWSKLYRKELFDKVRFPEGIMYEDVAVSYKIFNQANRVALIDIPFYHYRIRPNSITDNRRTNVEKEYHYFLNICQQIEFIVQQGIWREATYYLHKRGVHFISHLMLQPQGVDTEKKVTHALNYMRHYRFYYTVEFSPGIFLKRIWILHHLHSYRQVYRWMERLRYIVKSRHMHSP